MRGAILCFMEPVAEPIPSLRPGVTVWVARGIWLVIALFAVVLFTRYRTIPHVFLIIAIVAWWRWPRLRLAKVAGLVLATFVALELYLPFDVSMIDRSGPPSIRRLQMGLPAPEVVEQARSDDSVVLGGCMALGNEPRWILVW
jgi:hypothetical protein